MRHFSCVAESGSKWNYHFYFIFSFYFVLLWGTCKISIVLRIFLLFSFNGSSIFMCDVTKAYVSTCTLGYSFGTHVIHALVLFSRTHLVTLYQYRYNNILWCFTPFYNNNFSPHCYVIIFFWFFPPLSAKNTVLDSSPYYYFFTSIPSSSRIQ